MVTLKPYSASLGGQVRITLPVISGSDLTDAMNLLWPLIWFLTPQSLLAGHRLPAVDVGVGFLGLHVFFQPDLGQCFGLSVLERRTWILGQLLVEIEFFI